MTPRDQLRLSVMILVDDDGDLRDALSFAFETDGFKVHGFADAEDLLRSAPPSGCDCFVIDQNLPGISGLDLVDILRAKGLATPAILITTNPSRSIRGRARSANVAIIEKPLLGEALADNVRDAIRQSRAERSATD